jgi:hypothetical protein
MEIAKTTFLDRKLEIYSYLELLGFIENGAASGRPAIKCNDQEHRITPTQQKIMYAGVYLHLYNLVESTITLTINAVENAASKEINGNTKIMSEKMKKLWVKSIAEPHGTLSPEKRLEKAVALFDSIHGLLPFKMEIPKVGAGSWDYHLINAVSDSIGVSIEIDEQLKKRVVRPIRDEKGPLRLVKEIRNKLAHGSISFAECGGSYTVNELKYLSDIIIEYLGCVLNSYEVFINEKGYVNAQPSIS